jgi:hypothetical protein
MSVRRAGMHKAAKLVMNMQHLDQKASKNPVFQLLNDGNDLKGMVRASLFLSFHRLFFSFPHACLPFH